MMIFIVPIGCVIVAAVLMDLRNRRMKYSQQILHVREGESDNYLVGDNKYLNSGNELSFVCR